MRRPLQKQKKKNNVHASEYHLSQETHIWHCHFDHLNYKGLNTLAFKEMVTRLPPLKFQHKICGTYLIGKQ